MSDNRHIIFNTMNWDILSLKVSCSMKKLGTEALFENWVQWLKNFKFRGN